MRPFESLNSRVAFRMNPFGQSRWLNLGPRPDAEWMPPQLPRVMQDKQAQALSERVAQGIIWSAEAATRARLTKAAVYPQAPYRDAAWAIMLHLLFAETRGKLISVQGLGVLDEVLPGKASLWVEIMERLGLVDQLIAPGSNVPHIELTPRARQVMLELLLEPTTWNGPLLTQNITVSHLWQLSQTQNCLD